MNARKCDRCGRYYDKQDCDHYIEVHNLEWRGGRGKDFDLCPDCMRKLVSWLKNGLEQ